MVSKTKHRERAEWRKECALSVGVLNKRVPLRFGPMIGYVGHVVFDKHGNIVAAFKDQERAEAYLEWEEK